MLQLADRLSHRSYDVASGRAAAPDTYPDGSRITHDTGYQRAAADYITWLRAGNARQRSLAAATAKSCR